MKQTNIINTATAETIRSTLPKLPDAKTLRKRVRGAIASGEDVLGDAATTALYAASIDSAINSAVFHAFIAAASGNGEEAVKIARAYMTIDAKEAV